MKMKLQSLILPVPLIITVCIAKEIHSSFRAATSNADAQSTDSKSGILFSAEGDDHVRRPAIGKRLRNRNSRVAFPSSQNGYEQARPRIVGGTEASPGQYPYFGMLQMIYYW